MHETAIRNVFRKMTQTLFYNQGLLYGVIYFHLYQAQHDIKYEFT